MKTQQKRLLELLGTPDVRFKIPVYQRVYSWNDAQCEELWHDTLRAGRLNSEHFVGTVLYSVEEEAGGGTRQFDIIDGQQRMATLTIMLAAFVDYLRSADEAPGLIDAEEIGRTYLHIDSDAVVPKLTLARADSDTLAAVVGAGAMPDEPSERVVENYRLFKGHMEKEGDFEAELFWQGVQNLLAIVAELDDDDSPQLVFESLNSKGMPLTMGDLVRNSLLVGVGHKEQARLYHEYWTKIEAAIGDDPDGTKLNAAVHGWLAIRFPRARIHDAGDVYDVFKSYIIDVYDGSLEELLEELRGFCEMFGETIRNNPDKKFTAADWAKGKARTRAGSFDDLHGPVNTPLTRDLGASRRTFT